MTNTFFQGYALLIGVDQNSMPGMALPVVAKDVAALQAILLHTERCAYLPEHVRVLTGVHATRAGILAGLQWLREQVAAAPGGNATGLIYFSGHGWHDAQTGTPAYYLIPYDMNMFTPKSTALNAVDFAEAVEAVQPQRLLVVLDCCHAGGMEVKEVGSLAGRFEPAALPTDLLLGTAGQSAKAIVALADDAHEIDQLAVSGGRAVLSSSTGAQQSYIRLDGSMSIFTYHLVEALTGHAQPQEGAPTVLVSDLLSYVYRKTPKTAQEQQGRPQQPDGRLTGNFPVALVLGGRGLSKGEAPPNPLLAFAPSAGTLTVNTGGGDFTVRDKITHGDTIFGDKIGRNKIGGDQFKFGGSVSATALAVGRGTDATHSQGLDVAQWSQIMAPFAQASQRQGS